VAEGIRLSGTPVGRLMAGPGFLIDGPPEPQALRQAIAIRRLSSRDGCR
jgi:hypothetical protein